MTVGPPVQDARVATYHAITCTDDECDPTCEIGDPDETGGAHTSAPRHG